MSEVKVDTISERTTDAGVTVEGVKIEDGIATFQTAAGSPLVFEGATADAFETTFAFTDPTADRTITFPDSSFTVPTAGGLFASYAIIADEKADTTVGGTFTSGSWQTRDLNTEITDPDTIVSISANQFTLAAGSYLIQWSAPGFRCGAHKTRLYDVTGTAAIQEGSSSYQSFSQDVQSISNGSARVTPSGSNVYRIEHRCSNSASSGTTGFGEPSSFGDQEVYTSVTIYKES